MPAMIEKWRRARRYHATIRELRLLSPEELCALGIAPVQIDRLAAEASQVEVSCLPASNPESRQATLDLLAWDLQVLIGRARAIEEEMLEHLLISALEETRECQDGATATSHSLRQRRRGTTPLAALRPKLRNPR
jgi:uncharacterized protein YjiS (DUF1127 family)